MIRATAAGCDWTFVLVPIRYKSVIGHPRTGAAVLSRPVPGKKTTSTTVATLARPRHLAAGAGVFVIALGLTVLIGWVSNAHALVQVLPVLSPVRRNAAACLVLCGLALLAIALKGPRRLVVVCAGVAGVVGILTIVEHAVGVNLGIDELLGRAYIPQGVSNPGRMPPVSAICFALASVGLLLTFNTQSKRSALAVVFDGSIIAAVGLATIMAYALGSRGVYGWGHVTGAPFLTAVAFLVLGLGMLALAWQLDPDPAGIPRWLPVSIAIGGAVSTFSLWQGLIAGGHAPFALLPAVVLAGGCLMAPLFALTVYLAQRGHAQRDALRRDEARITGEKRVLEMVASARSLHDVLRALCKFVEEIAPECYCAAHLIDWSVPRFRCSAAPSLPASYNDAIDALPVRSESGPCGRAASLKTQVIAEDIEADPLWSESPFRVLALAHGLRSCWSTPILSLTGEVLGTFAVYQRKPASPTPLQQDLIAQVTHLARIAIERAQGEAALRRSEAFLAEGQRISATGSFVWRLDTDEITFSAELRRIFALENEPVTLERILTRVHPDDLPLVANKVDLARAGVVDHDYEVRVMMPDGSVKYLRTYAHANRDPDGHLEFAGAMQDITQQRLSAEALGAARSELARVSRITSLGALTASIAHEINQPLSGIITNASTCLRMLGADPPNVEGARETARRTIRDGNRAAEVITRLRALYSGRELSPQLVDLNEAAREVITLWLDDLQRNRVSLRTEFAPDLPMVMGDRIHLQQVVLNLLRNASDAMGGIYDRPRELLVKTQQDDDDRVRLSVRDVGVGFKPELADRLFGAFYTTKPGGLGMGLSVSRSIIESHHGNLWATLNSGPGATFSFSIPRDFRAAAGVRAPQPAQRPPRAARGERPAVGNP